MYDKRKLSRMGFPYPGSNTKEYAMKAKALLFGACVLFITMIVMPWRGQSTPTLDDAKAILDSNQLGNNAITLKPSSGVSIFFNRADRQIVDFGTGYAMIFDGKYALYGHTVQWEDALLSEVQYLPEPEGSGSHCADGTQRRIYVRTILPHRGSVQVKQWSSCLGEEVDEYFGQRTQWVIPAMIEQANKTAKGV